MDWSSLGKTIATTGATLLGTAIVGPLGPVAGALVANLFGADPKDPQDIIAKIQADPESALKLKTLEMQHETELKSLSNQHYETEVSDRASARQREIELAKAGIDDKTPDRLSYVVICGVFAMLLGLFLLSLYKVDVPSAVAGIMGAGARDLFDAFKNTISYWFGGSDSQSQ